jgi:hypothetical protein
MVSGGAQPCIDAQSGFGLTNLAPKQGLFGAGGQAYRALAQPVSLLCQAFGQRGGLLEAPPFHHDFLILY